MAWGSGTVRRCSSGSPRSTTPRRSGRSTTSRSPPPRPRSTWSPGPSRTSRSGWPPARGPTPWSWRSTRPARRAGFGSLSPWRDRPAYSTTVEDSVYVHRDHHGQGVGKAILTELVATGRPPRLPRLHGPDRRGPRGVDRAPPRLRVRGRGHRAGGRPEVREVARRGAHGAAAGGEPDGRTPFPRQSARTQRFTLGAPRDVTVSPGRRPGRVPALRRARGPGHRAVGPRPARRARSGAWPTPGALLAGGLDDLPAEERARRERAREAAAGITAYATDAAHRVAAAALAGQLRRGRPRRRHGAPAAGARHRDRPPARPDRPARGLGRRPRPLGGRARRPVLARGCWPTRTTPRCAGAWPSSSPPRRWTATAGTGGRPTARPSWWPAWTTRPVRPLVDRRPRPPGRRRRRRSPTRPPARPNADVSAWILRLDGTRTEVAWDRAAWPYLAAAAWDAHGPLVALHPRDQRPSRCAPSTRPPAPPRCCSPTATTRGSSGRPGTPGPARRRPAGDVLRRRRQPAPRRRRRSRSPPLDLHVRAVVHVGDDEVLFTANPVDDATGTLVWRWSAGGVEPLTTGERRAHRGGRRPTRSSSGRRRSTATAPPSRCSARRWAAAAARRDDLPAVRVIDSLAATPLVHPHVAIHHLGARRLPTAILLPHGHEPRHRSCRCCSTRTAGRTRSGSCRPAARSRRRSGSPTRASPWSSIDGRGTPGRGLGVGAGRPPRPGRPGARGPGRRPAGSPPRWSPTSTSTGWPSAAGASAATSPRSPCCGAPTCSTPPSPARPVTDWRLYDTFYTERYLGHPDADPAPYDRTLAAARRPRSSAARCCSCTASPTTTSSAPTRSSCPSALLAAGPAPPGAPAHRRHPHGLAGGRRREPAAAPARLPPRRASRLD